MVSIFKSFSIFSLVLLLGMSTACTGQLLKKVDNVLDLLEEDNGSISNSEPNSRSPQRSSSSSQGQSGSGFTNSATGTPMTNATGGITTGAIGTTEGLD